jgi:hypothetical protein
MKRRRSTAEDMKAERREAHMQRILAALAMLAALVLAGGAGSTGL